jgi:integrase
VAHVFQTFDKNGKPHPCWRIQYVDWRGRKKKATGTTSKADTEKLAHHVQSEQDAIKKGWKPAPKTSDKASDYAETVKQYLEWGAAGGGRRGFGWSVTHLNNRRSHLAWWQNRLQLNTLQDIFQEDIERAGRELLSAGKASKTAWGYVESIAAFCDWCVSRKLLAADPLQHLKSFNTSPLKPNRELTDAEVRSLLTHAPPERGLWYRVALSTGYRQNELRSLTVDCLDLFGPSLRLSACHTKNRQDARQPITRELADELAAPSKGKAANAPLLDMPTKNNTAQQLTRDLDAAGIVRETTAGRATFHSFRVNFINAVVKTGADLKTIMTLARHGSATMSMSTYAKADASLLRKAAESIAMDFKQSLVAPILPQQRVVGSEPCDVNSDSENTCRLVADAPCPVFIPAWGNAPGWDNAGLWPWQHGQTA